MSGFVGKWQMVSSENFDDFMKEIGVGWAMRQMGNVAKPNLNITVDGKHFVIKSESAVKNTVLEFDLDVEFDETTPDGRNVKTLVTIDSDGKLVQKQKGKVDATITRYLEGDSTLHVICEANNVKATRKYIRIAA